MIWPLMFVVILLVFPTPGVHAQRGLKSPHENLTIIDSHGIGEMRGLSVVVEKTSRHGRSTELQVVFKLQAPNPIIELAVAILTPDDIPALDRALASLRAIYKDAEANRPEASRRVEVSVRDLHLGWLMGVGDPRGWEFYVQASTPHPVRLKFLPGDISEMEHIAKNASETVRRLK